MFRNQNPNPLPSKTIVLEDRNIPAIAKYILSDKCKNIFFMVRLYKIYAQYSHIRCERWALESRLLQGYQTLDRPLLVRRPG